MRALIVGLSFLLAITAAAGAADGSRTARSRGDRGPRLSGFDADVRDALGVPADWRGAPPVATLTFDPGAIAQLAPLQERLAALEPGLADARVHHELGSAFAARGLRKAAAAEYLRALQLDPASAATLDNLGAMLHRAGALRTAEDALERARRLDPENALIAFNLAGVKADRGRVKEAQELYVKALDMDASLWLPASNPGVVGNVMAERALHALFLKRGGPMSFKLDRPAAP